MKMENGKGNGKGKGKGQAKQTENRENKTKGGAGKTTPSGSMLDRWRSPDLTMHWVRTQDSKLGTKDCGLWSELRGLRTEDSAADTGPRPGPRHHREMKTTQAKIQSYFYCRLVGCISRRAQGSGHIAERRKRGRPAYQGPPSWSGRVVPSTQKKIT